MNNVMLVLLFHRKYNSKLGFKLSKHILVRLTKFFFTSTSPYISICTNSEKLKGLLGKSIIKDSFGCLLFLCLESPQF